MDKKLKNINKRLSSYSIDLAVVFILTNFMSISAYQFITMYFPKLPPQESFGLFIIYQKLIFPLFFFNLFSYFLLVNYWGEGRSVGSIFSDFLVVTKEIEIMTFTQAFKRSAFQTLYLVSFATLVTSPLLLLPFIRKDHKGLACLFSGTRVFPIIDFYSIDNEVEEVLDNVIYLPATVEELATPEKEAA